MINLHFFFFFQTFMFDFIKSLIYVLFLLYYIFLIWKKHMSTKHIYEHTLFDLAKNI